MATWFDFALVVGIVAAWTAVIQVLQRRKVLEKWNMGAMGPFLLIRTKRGREALDRIASRERFWRWWGGFSVALVVVAMVAMTAALIWIATLVWRIPPERIPQPEWALGVPGLNPIIPIWEGIAGIAVAIFVHEYSHGILARLHKIKVTSMGLVFTVLPMGAFVEPDENELKAMDKRGRMRIFAAGPTANVVTAGVFLLLFLWLMGSIQPIAQGVGVVSVVDGSPAASAGLTSGMVITKFDGTPVNTPWTFAAAVAETVPGQVVSIETVEQSGAARTFAATMAARPEGDATFGYLGVASVYTGTERYYPLGTSYGDWDYAWSSTFFFVSLPLQRLSPFPAEMADYWVVTGPAAAIPEPAFLFLANLMYWIFWLNLMIGMTNSLPAVPLDGGYFFRDGLDRILTRLRGAWTAERKQRFVTGTSYAISLMILALVVWQFIGPRLVRGL